MIYGLFVANCFVEKLFIFAAWHPEIIILILTQPDRNLLNTLYGFICWACVKLLWYDAFLWSLSSMSQLNQQVIYWLHTHTKLLVTSVCAHQCDVACSCSRKRKKAVKLQTGMWSALKKIWAKRKRKHPLHGNKHSSQFPNVTKTKTLNKVDERILVPFIRSLSQIIQWSHPQCSIRRSSFDRFSGSETAESSKLLPRVLIERGKKKHLQSLL